MPKRISTCCAVKPLSLERNYVRALASKQQQTRWQAVERSLTLSCNFVSMRTGHDCAHPTWGSSCKECSMLRNQTMHSVPLALSTALLPSWLPRYITELYWHGACSMWCGCSAIMCPCCTSGQRPPSGHAAALRPASGEGCRIRQYCQASDGDLQHARKQQTASCCSMTTPQGTLRAQTVLTNASALEEKRWTRD